MPTVTLPFLPNSPQLTLMSILDILLVAILIYQLVIIVRGRRATAVFYGLIVLGIVYGISTLLHFELLRTILATLAPYTGFALIVMFQSEMRRLLSRLGRSRFLNIGRQMEKRDLIREIVFTVGKLAPEKIGALIVIERDIGLRTFTESGIRLDAYVSSQLLSVIFEHGSALHDGAVIIRGDRVVAAGCFLPLTMHPTRAPSGGTRHRAAVGITEEADCIAVVVSEETGQLSVAAFGELEPHITLARLEQRLADHAGAKGPMSWAAESVHSGRVHQDIAVVPSRPWRRP